MSISEPRVYPVCMIVDLLALIAGLAAFVVVVVAAASCKSSFFICRRTPNLGNSFGGAQGNRFVPIMSIPIRHM